MDAKLDKILDAVESVKSQVEEQEEKINRLQSSSKSWSKRDKTTM